MDFQFAVPTIAQFKMVLDIVNKPYHECDMLDEYNITNYREIVASQKEGYYFFIVTHPFIYTIINNKNIQIPLGFINFTVKDAVYKDKNDKTFMIIYVDTRCSFGRWPVIDNYLGAISDLNKTKINIGEELNVFLEEGAIRLKNEKGIDKILLFNLATTEAEAYHTKNGWKKNAEKVLRGLTNVNSGEKSLSELEKSEVIIPGSNHMYKILN